MRPVRRESRGGEAPKGDRGESAADLSRPACNRCRESGGRFRQCPGELPLLSRGNRTRSWGPERGPGRRTHYAARMSEDVPRTVSYYSRSLSVDAPTKEILASHGLDDSCPPELQIRFQVYKRVVVSAGLVTPDGEESKVLSAHVAHSCHDHTPRRRRMKRRRMVAAGSCSAQLGVRAGPDR